MTVRTAHDTTDRLRTEPYEVGQHDPVRDGDVRSREVRNRAGSMRAGAVAEPPPDFPSAELPTVPSRVGGPVAEAWREGTLTRAQELESLCDWMVVVQPQRDANDVLVHAVRVHLEAAREAAQVAALDPKRVLHLPRYGSLRERAMSNLDAAEAHLLNLAPADYLLGQLPSLLQHVRCHLVPGDARGDEMEAIAARIFVKNAACPQATAMGQAQHEEQRKIVARKRPQIVAAMRAASSAGLREQVRVRNFRDVLVATTVVLSLLAVALAVTGLRYPSLIPLCFTPEEAGSAVVVCPTQQSAPFATAPTGSNSVNAARDIDDAVQETVRPWDLLLVELIGLAAAAVAAAAAIRKIRGSSERYGVPLALAALKLPTGAVTAFLGLLLMRGQFVPGLSALDTSAQILAWALVFGYAQQLFTRLVDQQGQAVLNSVRGAGKAGAAANPQSSGSPR